MNLYRLFFLKTGFFCSVCMRGIATTVGRTARAFNIPLVITGTSLRTEEHVAPEFFENGDLTFFKQVLKGENLESEEIPLLYGDNWFQIVERALTTFQINLPDFIDWNYDHIFRTISSELNWRTRESDAEHSDCKVENIVSYFRYVKFPVLVPEMLRFSKLVSVGQMTRDEAKLKVLKNAAGVSEPDNLDWLLDSLNISKIQMNQVLKNPFRHMKYHKQENPLRRSLRTFKRLLLDRILGRN